MQSKTLLFVLFFGFCCVWAQDSSGSSDGSGSGSRSSDESSSDDSDEKGFHDSCDDEDKNYEYPCENLDIDCIRDFMASSKRCVPVSHEEGEPIQKGNQTGHMPVIGAKVLCTNYRSTYSNYKIISFYLNKDTNTLVITIKFERVKIETDRSYWTFYHVGCSPKIVETPVYVYYSADIRIEIPWGPYAALRGVRVSYINTNPDPEFYVGEEVTDSSDKHVQRSFNTLLEKIPVAVKELLLTKSLHIIVDFIEAYICDFRTHYDHQVDNWIY